MMDNPPPSRSDYDLPIRIGHGELAIPGAGHARRDTWTLFLREAVTLVPEFLPSLLTEEAFAIVARYPDGERPWSTRMEPNHEMWRYVRCWCDAWHFHEEAAFKELSARAENTNYRKFLAMQKGEPVPSEFSEPPRIFVDVVSYSDDGIVDSGTATALAPRFLDPAVASSLFRWNFENETKQRGLQRMLDAVRSDLEHEMDRVDTQARAHGAITAPTKRERKHFAWTVQSKILGRTYEEIARGEASPRKHRHDDELNPTIDASIVSRAVRDICKLLGITPPPKQVGRPKHSPAT